MKMTQLESFEQLVVRACKSQNPEQNLNRVLKRFFVPHEQKQFRKGQIVNNLLQPIVCRYFPMSSVKLHHELINQTHQNDFINHTNGEDPKEDIGINFLMNSMYMVYLNQIRFTSNFQLKRVGYRPPLVFRRNNGEV